VFAFSSSSGDTYSGVPTKRCVLEGRDRETETETKTETETETEAVPKSVDLQKILKK
jgi:hypothetical protein